MTTYAVREPSEEELEQVQWAREAQQKEQGVIQECLRQLVTLATALLAGSSAMLGQLQMPLFFKGTSVLLLIVSLALALLGFLPMTATIDIRCPREIERARTSGLTYRANCLRVAAFLLFLALAMFSGGMFAGVIGSK